MNFSTKKKERQSECYIAAANARSLEANHTYSKQISKWKCNHRGWEHSSRPNEQIYKNVGWISADRSNKATLLLTIPRCLLSRLQRISRAQCSKLLFINQAWGLSPGPVAKLYGTGRSYRYSRYRAAVLVSGMDSDLEAFSHNPTDGSFSPLAFQLSENTNYLNQRFLSY